jgi:hypothetical protein
VSDSAASSVIAPRVSRAAVLDTWTSADWSGGVNVCGLQPFDQLTVTTKNSVYTLIVVCPRSGDVQVRGGALFPSFTKARISGSSLGGGLLKCHIVHPGFCLELAHRDLGAIITTRVRTVTVSHGDETSSPVM